MTGYASSNLPPGCLPSDIDRLCSDKDDSDPVCSDCRQPLGPELECKTCAEEMRAENEEAARFTSKEAA